MTTSSDPNRYVYGNRPVHVHKGPDGLEWHCNSPYCIQMAVNAPDAGGPQVIIEGLEPWRGRQ